LTAKLRRISNTTARKIALAAQGFADPRPSGPVTAAHLRRVIRRVGMLQLDSVNVLVRSHYLPTFSRLGPYPTALLDDYAFRRRKLFEYWGHAASLIPVEHFPLFRHRMDRASHWGMQSFADKRADYVDTVLNEVRTNGPIPVGDLAEPGERAGSWWGWGEGKLALEHLFHRGLITTAGRQAFTRYYDVTDRVIPAEHYNAPAASEDNARRDLLLLAARSLGIGTARDLADYYRLPLLPCRQTLRELADSGALERVEVKDWKDEAFLHPEARIPRRVEARALLSPFDSLVWERGRTERLFNFRYRIEIYTPAPKRVYGYYVLPFLMNDAIVARVDLKSDRQSKRLLVRAAHAEPGGDKDAVAAALSEELRSIAAWLGLTDVVITPAGDLAPALAKRL
jgi:uncharacterized protein YcaQ